MLCLSTSVVLDWHCGKRKPWHMTVCMKTRERSTGPYRRSIESGWAIKPQPNCLPCCNYSDFDHFLSQKKGHKWLLIPLFVKHNIGYNHRSVLINPDLFLFRIQCWNLYVPRRKAILLEFLYLDFCFIQSWGFCFTQFLVRIKLIL